MDFGYLGPIMALGLGAVGSSIGCGLAGMTCHGVMSKTDERHGLYMLFQQCLRRRRSMVSY
jgi:V/A-type H+-transporting ATPase subunit K